MIALGAHTPLPVQHPIFAARISRHRKHGWQSDRIAPLVYEIINNEGAVYGIYCAIRLGRYTDTTEYYEVHASADRDTLPFWAPDRDCP